MNDQIVDLTHYIESVNMDNEGPPEDIVNQTLQHFDVDFKDIKGEVKISKLEILKAEESNKNTIFEEYESVSYKILFVTYNIPFVLRLLSFQNENQFQILKLDIQPGTVNIKKELEYCCNSLQRRRNLNLMFKTLITFSRFIESRRIITDLILKKNKNIQIEQNKDGGIIIVYTDEKRKVRLGIFWSISCSSSHEVTDIIEIYYKVVELPNKNNITLILNMLTEPCLDFTKKYHLWKSLLDDLSERTLLILIDKMPDSSTSPSVSTCHGIKEREALDLTVLSDSEETSEILQVVEVDMRPDDSTTKNVSSTSLNINGVDDSEVCVLSDSELPSKSSPGKVSKRLKRSPIEVISICDDIIEGHKKKSGLKQALRRSRIIKDSTMPDKFTAQNISSHSKVNGPEAEGISVLSGLPSKNIKMHKSTTSAILSKNNNIDSEKSKTSLVIKVAKMPDNSTSTNAPSDSQYINDHETGKVIVLSGITLPSKRSLAEVNETPGSTTTKDISNCPVLRDEEAQTELLNSKRSERLLVVNVDKMPNKFSTNVLNDTTTKSLMVVVDKMVSSSSMETDSLCSQEKTEGIRIVTSDSEDDDVEEDLRCTENENLQTSSMMKVSSSTETLAKRISETVHVPMDVLTYLQLGNSKIIQKLKNKLTASAQRKSLRSKVRSRLFGNKQDESETSHSSECGLRPGAKRSSDLSDNDNSSLDSTEWNTSDSDIDLDDMKKLLPRTFLKNTRSRLNPARKKLQRNNRVLNLSRKSPDISSIYNTQESFTLSSSSQKSSHISSEQDKTNISTPRRSIRINNTGEISNLSSPTARSLLPTPPRGLGFQYSNSLRQTPARRVATSTISPSDGPILVSDSALPNNLLNVSLPKRNQVANCPQRNVQTGLVPDTPVSLPSIVELNLSTPFKRAKMIDDDDLEITSVTYIVPD